MGTMEYELNRLPRNCSKKEIVDEIRRVDSLVAKNRLTTQEYDQHAKISSSTVRRKLGGWENALIATGIGHKYSGIRVTRKMSQQSKCLSNEQVLSELRRIAANLQQDYITQENINSHSEVISSSTVVYRFGSWVEGVEKAGLKISPGYHRKYSNNEYFENLLNVWTHYGRQPYYREMDVKPSEISSGAYENRFGSWRKALEAFVKKMNRENGVDANILGKERPEPLIAEEIKPHHISVEDHRGISLGLRYKVLSRDKFKCVQCGTSPATDPTTKLHVDHIIPFSQGGKTELTNLQILCESCNLGKGNRIFE